jgi:hypothetical protein
MGLLYLYFYIQFSFEIQRFLSLQITIFGSVCLMQKTKFSRNAKKWVANCSSPQPIVTLHGTFPSGSFLQQGGNKRCDHQNFTVGNI